MFQINDTVMYGHLGACRITDLCERTFLDTKRLYYVLHPVYGEDTTIYRPVDSEKIPMRKLLCVEEVRRLIQAIPDGQAPWIEDKQQRSQAQANILKQGDHEGMIHLIKTLYSKRQEKAQTGKKLYAADESAMQEAEKLLYQEFALVLGIRPEEVVPFIISELEPDAAPMGSQ